jgi:hypothetical protein
MDGNKPKQTASFLIGDWEVWNSKQRFKNSMENYHFIAEKDKNVEPRQLGIEATTKFKRVDDQTMQT